MTVSPMASGPAVDEAVDHVGVGKVVRLARDEVDMQVGEGLAGRHPVLKAQPGPGRSGKAEAHRLGGGVLGEGGRGEGTHFHRDVECGGSVVRADDALDRADGLEEVDQLI